MNVPKKITPCPIIESVVEVRFSNNVPVEAMAGQLYTKFSGVFSRFEKLPITQIPEYALSNDPALSYSPHFRLAADSFAIQVGPRSLSLVHTGTYLGWSSFKKHIHDVFDFAEQGGLFVKPERLGLRYISFFNAVNIFEKIKMELKLGNRNLLSNPSNIVRTEFNEDDFLKVVQLSNNAFHNLAAGSAVDIDIISIINDSIKLDFRSVFEKAHDFEKQLFFGILKDDFLTTFNPEY